MLYIADLGISVMVHIIGMSVNSGAYQKMKAGYENAENFMESSAAKKRVIQASTHGRGNMSRVGMGSSQVTQYSSAANISVELSSVKKDVLQMMKSLPAEVNIEIADEIRERIRSGNWPIDRQESNNAIKAMIADYSALI